MARLTLLSLLLATILMATTLATITPPRPAAGQQLTREMMNPEFVNHNRLGTNYNPQKMIHKDNVEHLELKWLYPLPSATQLGGPKLVGNGIKRKNLGIDMGSSDRCKGPLRLWLF